MQDEQFINQIETLKNKLIRAQRQLAGLKEKARLLEMQYDDSKQREKNNNDVVLELLERQRELNVMLNRANIMLNRTQEAIALTSIELNEMAKALPEPKKAEWSQRVAKINELFKKTGIQDAEMLAPENPTVQDEESLDTDELKQESETAFDWKESIWKRPEPHKPPEVEATLVEEPEKTAPPLDPEPEAVLVGAHSEGDKRDLSLLEEAESLAFPPRRKSWWQRIAS